MNEELAIDAFSALAHPTRLAIFRLLVKNMPEAVPSLKIAEMLGAKPSTLSGHLAVLKRAKLLTSTRHQREIRYTTNLTAMHELIGFLLADCCGGNLKNCEQVLALLDVGRIDAGK